MAGQNMTGVQTNAERKILNNLKKTSAGRRLFRAAVWTVLTPVAVVFLLAVALYLPPVQQWAVAKAAVWASEETGMEVSVGYVRLACPLDLKMEEVKAGELAEIRNVYVNVELWPLLGGVVNVEALEMNGLRLNTDTLVAAAVVKGEMKTLTLESHGIDLMKELVTLDRVRIDGADLDVWLNDSVPEDTTEALPWKIDLKRAEMRNSRVRLRGTGLDMMAGIGRLSAENAWIDLLKEEYKVGHVEMKEGSVRYALDAGRPLEESPVFLDKLYADVDSIRFCSPNVRMRVNKIGTPYSTLRAAVDMDLTAFDFKLALEGSIGKEDMRIARDFLPAGILEKLPDSHLFVSTQLQGNAKAVDIHDLLVRWPGAAEMTANGRVENPLDMERLSTDLQCTFDLPDIGFAAKFIDPKMAAQAGFSIPNGLPLKASMNLNGGMNDLGINDLTVSIPGRMDVKMNGRVLSLNDLNNLKTDLCLSMKAPNIDFLTACISPQMLRKLGVKIPHGIGVSGDVCMKGDNYGVDLLLTEGGGRVKLNGDVNLASESYDLTAQVSNVDVKHFMPSIGVGRVSTNLKAKGQSFDVMSKRARLTASGNVGQLHYGKYNLNGIGFDANISNGSAAAQFDMDNELLHGAGNAHFLLSTDIVKGTLMAEVFQIDFKKLGLTEVPLKFGLCSHVDLDYDFGENVSLKGLISDLTLKGEKHVFHPDDIVLDFLSRPDTVRCVLDCGDLHASIKSQGSYLRLIEKADGMTEVFDSIISQKRLDLATLWKTLPVATLRFKAGQENPLSRFITFNGIRYEMMDVLFKTSPRTGINGNMEIFGMKKDSLLLDTIRLNLKSDTTRCVYYGQVCNNEKNPDFTFNAKFAGRVQERGSTLGMAIYDDQGKLGVKMGLEGELLDNGTKIRFSRETPILGYKQFKVNKDNYILLTSDNRITADMRLRADDGMAIGIYTDDDNTDALQDVTFTLQNFNLKEILSSIPYAPDLAGVLNGDFHAIIENDEAQTLSVSSSTSVKNLAYEGLKVGDVSADFVYMPDTAGTHHFDGVLFMNDEEICSAVGDFRPIGNGELNAKVIMREMPMHMLNGFIPDQLIGFKGKGDGELTISGQMDKPVVNGEVFLDSCHMYSVPYGVDMRFSNDPVAIKNSRLLLENFEMYSYGDNPLTVAGNVDFSDLSKVRMNVRMKANNFMIINAKENARSEVFGKAYVDFTGAINGLLDNLTMQGRLDVLPSTDISYILRDSPLTTDNHLDELVKFVNLKDSVVETVARPTLMGFNMTMGINITKGARVMCYLNTDLSNYVDLVGGGNLIMKYSPASDLTLTGRYSLDGGQMKYSLPIIPLKTFEIKDGSYVEFTGDIMNPRLNITATEKLKSQVNTNGAGGRSVQFECGVVITKTLQDMGLEFTLDAPEDFELSNDLKAMSADARGKLAVTMLTTGLYLADGNTNNFTMNTALSQFLQGEINNITGNALRTLDLSLGLDNTTDQAGNSHMDYSFKFSKRFFNNRLKVTIGGIVSTGNSMDRGQNNSVFDNLSLEYRLDKSGSTYLNGYYNNNAYDWLDGNTEEFSGGIMWRRSLLRFFDLFRFNSGKSAAPAMILAPRDSVSRDSLTKI